MRRSTAAAVGTLTGAALIVGVRLSVQPPAPPAAAQSPVDLVDNPSTPKPSGSAAKKPAGKKTTAPAQNVSMNGPLSSNPSARSLAAEPAACTATTNTTTDSAWTRSESTVIRRMAVAP